MPRDMLTGKKIPRDFMLKKVVGACVLAAREASENAQVHRPGSLWVLQDATGLSWWTCRRWFRKARRLGLVAPDPVGGMVFARATLKGLRYLHSFEA